MPPSVSSSVVEVLGSVGAAVVGSSGVGFVVGSVGVSVVGSSGVGLLLGSSGVGITGSVSVGVTTGSVSVGVVSVVVAARMPISPKAAPTVKVIDTNKHAISASAIAFCKRVFAVKKNNSFFMFFLNSKCEMPHAVN